MPLVVRLSTKGHTRTGKTLPPLTYKIDVAVKQSNGEKTEHLGSCMYQGHRERPHKPALP
jgi:hypothetical protein